jgi:benzylsuccinate CoA-transferase BbsF subunit
LCRVMGQPAWTREDRFATLLGRKAHEDDLDALIGQWTQEWEAYDLMRTLQRAGVPAGVVQTSQDLFEDPQLQHRGHFVFLEHPEVGHHPVQRSEFRLSHAPGEFRSPAPRLGQHTMQVCKEILKMSEDEITALTEAGILE